MGAGNAAPLLKGGKVDCGTLRVMVNDRVSRSRREPAVGGRQV